ncbi:MAG: sterol desaturase family protein [Gammaproteobacteria bacterium]
MVWDDWVVGHEVTIRLGFFLGVFAIVACWERFAPRRALTFPRPVRWLNNLALLLLDGLAVRLLYPAAAAGIAALAGQRGWGLFNAHAAPLPLATVVSVIAMDGVIYLQHVMFHAVPALWRLHRVHHADPDCDITTGTRFHPVEIILSMLIKSAAILTLGPPVIAVVIFEVLLNGTAMFNHGNIRLPRRADRVLRLFVVTPDMHRVHHSAHRDESDTNFGFNLPWWDRLFGTYRDQPRDGHLSMSIGLRGFHQPRQITRLPGMLLMPFVAGADAHARSRQSGNTDSRD